MRQRAPQRGSGRFTPGWLTLTSPKDRLPFSVPFSGRRRLCIGRGAVQPEGFCPWVRVDLYRAISALAGRVETGWYGSNVSVECRAGGVRPVAVLSAGPDEKNRDGG